MVLVGPAAQRFDLAPVPANTLVVHGELDELVPLSAVFDWARPQEIPVVVLPGADHFFHRRLTQLKSLVSAFVARAQGVQTAADESI
jgi:alpha/beta superfamily hydrolase